MSSFRADAKYAAVNIIAACLLISLLLCPYIVLFLVMGEHFDVSPQIVIALPLFPVIVGGYSFLERWLSRVDRPIEQPTLSQNQKLLFICGLILFTLANLIGWALVFDNLGALVWMLYGALGLTYICSLEYVMLASPLLLWWSIRQYIRLFKRIASGAW